MESITQIVKKNARKALSDKWGRAIIVIMLYLAVNIFFGIVDVVISLTLDLPTFADIANTPNLFLDNNINITIPSIIASITITLMYFFIVTPLELGVDNWYYHLVGGENDEILSVFQFFESTKLLIKSWGIKINIFIRMIGFAILCLSPGLIILYLNKYFFLEYTTKTEMIISSLLLLCGISLIVVGVVFMFIAKLRYFLTKYLIIDDNKMKVKQAIILSVKLTKGYKGQLFRFYLSYLGWLFLCVFFAPIFYVAPYLMSGKSLYAKILIENYKKNMLLKQETEPTIIKDVDVIKEDDSSTSNN